MHHIEFLVHVVNSLFLSCLIVCFTLVIESMGYFMTNNDPNSAIIQRLGKVLTVEQRLEDTRRKHWESERLFILPCTFIGNKH